MRQEAQPSDRLRLRCDFGTMRKRKKNYYRILGVSRNADLNTIKKAFRELAKKYHPDKTSGHAEHTEKFKEVSEAYEVLSDEQKRAEHDRELTERERPPRRPYRSSPVPGWVSRPDPLEEIFSFIDAVSGGPAVRPTRATPFEQLELELTLTPEESWAGGEVAVELPPRACRYCAGRGVRLGRVCSLCLGSGSAPTVTVRIPIPENVTSGTRKRYQFLLPGGDAVVVHVTYRIQSH